MDIWQSVQVKKDGHPRNGQAGTVFAYNRETQPDEVAVKFDDEGGTVEAVAIVDLVTL